MGVVIFFIVLSIISIVILLIAFDDEIFGPLFFIFSLLGTCGFVLSSTLYDMTSEWVEKDVEIARTSRLVIVDDGQKTWEFDSYEDVSNINESTVFLFESTTNFWGSENIEDIKYVNN